MVELELDGKIVSGNSGATILEVALKEGKYITPFCASTANFEVV